ncbi:endo-1,34-beta-glucanase [Aspergillus sclerotialis]|uniref:Endo-1,34-beta-glucanase n=1 Tax=Aspergillus sclerotialis TaxID=2070753 RepID=A0A3A3A385_9EURO|nr:endo-1,34-beta-glucanase [Aspergillus sclerotialis]
MDTRNPSAIPGNGNKQRPSRKDMQTTTLRTSDGTLLPNGFPDNPNTVIRDIKDPLVTRPNIMTRILCFYRSEQAYRHKVDFLLSKTVAISNDVARRPLTQEEVDAIVEHTSLHAYRDRLGIPVGIATAVLQTWTEVAMREMFPGPVRLWELVRHSGQRPGPALRDWLSVRGITRTALWQAAGKPSIVRLIFYPLFGYSVSSTIGGLRAAMGMHADERLKEFSESLKTGKAEFKQQTIPAVTQGYRKMAEERERGLGQDQSQASQNGYGLGQPQTQEPVFSELDQSPYSDSPTQTFKQPQFNGYPRRPTPSPAPSTDNTGDFFDDASPVAPDYQSQPAPQTQGSAWERIRQQNMSGGDQPQRTRETYYSGDRSRPSDDYGYAKEKEREQARADFDKLLEAERNMSTDNGGGSGWNRRW